MAIELRGESLSVSFDGKPLSEPEQLRPFDALFAESPSPRSRLLASALLALCRLSSKPVRVVSGEGASRRLVTIRVDGDDEVQPIRAPGPTMLEARVPMDSEVAALKIRRLAESCKLFPARLTLDRELQPRFNPRPPGSFFKRGATRGWIGLPAWIGRPSQLHVSLLGVAAGTREVELSYGSVEAWVNDDLAAVDLSGSIAESARWKRLLRLVELESYRLMLRVAASQRSRMRRAWRVLRSDSLGLEVWRRRLEWGPRGDPDGLDFLESLSAAFSGGDRRRVALRELLWTAHASLWLRDLVARLEGLVAPPPRVARAVTSAPIFFGAGGELLSVETLRAETWRYTCRWPADAGAAAGTPQAVWCASRKDELWLKTFVWPSRK